MTTDEPAIAGVVLAAGTSSRFGDDPPKQLALFDGEPLVRRAVATALAARLSPLVVVVGHRAREVEGALADLPISTVVNPLFADGQASSVRAGLAAAHEAADAVLFLPCDQPLLTSGALDRMVDAFLRSEARSEAIVAATAGGRRGSPVLFGRAYFDALAAIEGDEGGRQVLHQHPAAILEVELPGPMLADVDTPQDLARLAGSDL